MTNKVFHLANIFRAVLRISEARGNTSARTLYCIRTFKRVMNAHMKPK